MRATNDCTDQLIEPLLELIKTLKKFLGISSGSFSVVLIVSYKMVMHSKCQLFTTSQFL